MHRVNPYVLFRPAHILNLRHNCINLFRLSSHGNLHSCESNLLLESGHLLKSNPQTIHILTISTHVSPFLKILYLNHHSILFIKIDTSSYHTLTFIHFISKTSNSYLIKQIIRISIKTFKLTSLI